MSSRQLRRLTIAPRRGEGRALRFVASEVPHGPRSPPECHVRGLTEVWVGSVLRERPCGELAPVAPAYHRPGMRYPPIGAGAIEVGSLYSLSK